MSYYFEIDPFGWYYPTSYRPWNELRRLSRHLNSLTRELFSNESESDRETRDEDTEKQKQDTTVPPPPPTTTTASIASESTTNAAAATTTTETGVTTGEMKVDSTNTTGTGINSSDTKLSKKEEEEEDDIYDEWFKRLRGNYSHGCRYSPCVDIRETPEQWIVEAEIPGMNKEDITVNIHEGILSINGEHSSAKEKKQEGELRIRERRYGKFVRQIRLPKTIDGDKVEGRYENGILRITLGKRAILPPPEPKKITIA